MRLLPPLAYARNTRTVARLNLIKEQIAKVEASTTEGLAFALMRIKGIGMIDTTLLACKGYIRDFRNRCHLGHWAGLTSARWSSGRMYWDQGITQSGPSKDFPIIFRWLGAGFIISIEAHCLFGIVTEPRMAMVAIKRSLLSSWDVNFWLFCGCGHPGV